MNKSYVISAKLTKEIFTIFLHSEGGHYKDALLQATRFMVLQLFIVINVICNFTVCSKSLQKICYNHIKGLKSDENSPYLDALVSLMSCEKLMYIFFLKSPLTKSKSSYFDKKG